MKRLCILSPRSQRLTQCLQCNTVRTLEPDKTKYTVLSQRWLLGASDEVLYNDVVGGEDVSDKPGFAKLKAFCDLPRSLGYPLAWIDTVCINKESAMEPGTAPILSSGLAP